MPISLPATVLAFSGVVLMTAIPAQGAVTADQVNLADYSQGTLVASTTLRTSEQSPGFYGNMQSVTAGLTGTLARLDLQIYATPQHDPGATFRVELYEGEPGLAGPGALAGARTFTMADLPSSADLNQGSVFSVDLSSLGFQVTAGSKFSYAVAIANEMVDRRGPYVVVGHFNGVDENGAPQIVGLDYAGGLNVILSTDGRHEISLFDRGFRTWVDVTGVPEPASWAMMLAGFGMAGAAVRRTTRQVRFDAVARG